MFTETNVRELPEDSVDMSGGDEHIREIADETGCDYMTYHSSRTMSHINGHEVEVFYDEGGSYYSPWKAFCKGFGTYSGSSREEAIESLLSRINR